MDSQYGLGAANAANVAKATFKAIAGLSTRAEVMARRGLAGEAVKNN